MTGAAYVRRSAESAIRRPQNRARATGTALVAGRTIIAVLGVALAVAVATAWAATTPLPTPAGLVSDFAGVIDAATEAALTARIGELRRTTGAEIAVVTVPSTAPDTAFDYAMRLAEAWKPGSPGKDNGVVFLVAVDDREMFIATGYGIEGALPDGLVGEIRDRDIVPRFRAGDIPGGIAAGVERLAQIIAKEYGVTLAPARAAHAAPRGTQSGGLDPTTIVVLMILSLVVLSLFAAALNGANANRRRRWSGGPMWGGSFGGGGFGGHGGGFGGGSGGFGGGGFGGGGAGGKW